MILTDREWLRFVTVGIVAGGGLGATYTAALLYLGHVLAWATAGAIIATGAIALFVHVAVRKLLDGATEPAPADANTTEDSA